MRGKEYIMIFNNAVSVPSGWELRFITVTFDQFPFSELLAVDPKVKDLDKAIIDAVKEYSGSLTGHHALMMVRNNKEGDEPFYNQLLDLLPVDVCKKHGFVILVGIVVNNGIVLVDCTNRLRESGMDRTEAVVEAGRMRMRPVLMTALTTVLGLLPMSLGIGLGVTLVQPVAIAGIGGLAYATLMTLVLVPVLYDGLHKKPLRRVTKEDLAETEIETEEVI